MTSRSESLVDPELKPLLGTFPPLALSAADLPAIRAGFMSMFEQASQPAPGAIAPQARVEAMTVPGPSGAPSVRVVTYRPTEAQGLLPALLHIHGGGYVIGAPEMMEPANRLLASELGCLVVSVDYRLAPEAPHPAPVEDCYAALQWLHAKADQLGVDRSRIGVKGESAGGGLAAALALLARDRGGPELAFQHLIYPMLDDRTCVDPDPNPFVGEFVWTPAQNLFGWSSLLGAPPGSDGVSPYAAAARAPTLSGLPATFIAVGDLDLFLEEDLDYARRLGRAGVPVELHVYPGAFHGFQMAQAARVSIAAERDSREALRHGLKSGRWARK